MEKLKGTIRLDIPAGADIETAANQAQFIADQMKQDVYFSFNRVDCRAHPGGSAELLAERQSRAQRSVLRVNSNPALDFCEVIHMEDR